MALGYRYKGGKKGGTLLRDKRSLLKSVPRIAEDSIKVSESGRWPRRFAYLFLILFVSFSLFMAGGVLSVKFREVFHRAAGIFQGQSGGDEELLHGSADGDVAAGFSDVAGTGEAARALKYLKAKGVIQGYADGTFRPGEPLTRAALVFLIGKVNHAMPHVYLNSYCFRDVQDQWFAPNVCAAKKAGWVGGYENNYFRPENPVSRAEGLKIIVTVFGARDLIIKQAETEESIPEPGALDSTEETIPQWYDQYLGVASGNNWLGADFNKGKINDPMTRLEAAEILYRIISSGAALKG